MKSAIFDKILRLARIAEAIALQHITKIRYLVLIGTLAASWLAYYFKLVFDWSLIGWLLMLSLFLLPTILLFYVYIALAAFIGLPQRVLVIINDTKEKAHAFQESRHHEPLTKVKVSDFMEVGNLLFEVMALGSEASGMVVIVQEILLFANPIFMLLIGIAIAVLLLLIALSLVTGFLFVF